MRGADQEQNPPVAAGERGPMTDRGCHMPPRLGCVLHATEVQSSRGNLNLVHPQVNENTFLIPTLRPNPQDGQVRPVRPYQEGAVSSATRTACTC